METQQHIARLFALIERMRTFKGLTARQLAIAADITPQYYSELIHGKKTPTIGIVLLLIDAVDGEINVNLKL
jgi:transcriptional regulator with XRE-family HTH domain